MAFCKYIVAILVAAGAFQVAESQWNWQTPLPQGNNLTKVCFIDSLNGWAAGEDGTILHTSDGGASWYEQEYARTDNILSLSMRSQLEGWAAGDNGTILHTTDSGDDWNEQTSGITTGINAVTFHDSLDGWAAGDNELILHTSDGGATWSLQHQAVTPSSINAMTFLTLNKGWAVGSGRSVLHTTDGGITWIKGTVGTQPVYYSTVCFPDSSLGLIAGSGGVILRSINGGTTWSEISSGVTGTLNQIVMKNSLVGWIVGDAGILLRTTDGGMSWSHSIIGSGDALSGLSRINGTMWIVGEYGRILKSTNDGSSWFSLDSGTRLSANWIDFPSRDVGVVVGQTGLILRTTNGGTSWAEQASPAPSTSCYGVKFTDTNHGCAVGDDGLILRTSDGSTWTMPVSHVAHSLLGVSFAGSSQGWIVGGEFVGFTGVILHSTDGGSSWGVQANNVANVLYGVSFADANNGWATGENGFILHTTNGGTNWSPQTSTTHQAIFWCQFVDGMNGWAVGDSGLILHTTNGGTSWNLQSSGVSELLYSITATSTLHAFAGGDLGTILETSDGGLHWISQYSRTIQGLFGIASIDDSSIWSCGDYGTVLKYTTPPQIVTTISGSIFNDANDNGILDAGEPELAGWTVKLTGTMTDSTITKSDGTFSFSNLPFGMYTLSQVLRPSWNETYPSLPGSYSFTLDDNSPDFAGNFGNYSASAHEYPVSGGWNLLSLPLNVSDNRQSSLYPTATSAAFVYINTYVSEDTIPNSFGYWLKFAKPQSITLLGTPRLSDTIAVHPGWNLIGSISDPVPTSLVTGNPPGLVTSNFFGYQDGYYATDTIYPGTGYWINLTQAGQLILSSSHSRSSMSSRIRIVPTSELPPPPPKSSRESTDDIPATFALKQNYPNPFNPSTRIPFEIPASGFVSLKVYDILGREVATLVHEELKAGSHEAEFNSSLLTSGVYFYRLASGSLTSTHSMLLMK